MIFSFVLLSSDVNLCSQRDGGQPPAVAHIDTIRRHEVDEVLRHVRDSANSIIVMKYVNAWFPAYILPTSETW